MDLSSALESPRISKKRRIELPLKKRYQNCESSFSPLLVINRNGSPSDDRASSDDSALPKTPCSGQSSTSSMDTEDCSTFPLDFTLPNRTRAKFRSGHQEMFKKESTIDQDGIDQGFESASTSSSNSAQAEPLDLTEKSPAQSTGQHSYPFDLSAAISATYPLGLFGNGLLMFQSGLMDQSSKGPSYPIFSPQTVSNLSTAKKPKGKQSKHQWDSSKPISSQSISQVIGNRSICQSIIQSIGDHSIGQSINNQSVTQSINNQSPYQSIDNQSISTADHSSSKIDHGLDDEVFFNKLRRNYKNMTIERRMEANARERTRVHTIGAAFDRLRKLIPSSTAEQKLSKLSILRIACRYIMLLASMNGLDYSLEQRGYTVEECIDMLTDTINCESKFKRVP